MKRTLLSAAAGCLLALLAGCSAPAQPGGQNESAGDPAQPGGQGGVSGGQISREDALAIALDNAGVPAEDAYNIKNKTDEDGGIPIYDIEFETDYGNYDFEVAIDGGRIVGADYEVDEEWLDALGSRAAVTAEEAAAIAAAKVPGARAEDIQLREEGGDGRGRYEGRLTLDGMEYEFELDPRTGIIFDWTADRRD